MIDKFQNRLKRIGIDVELSLNYPWVYLSKVNGLTVREKFLADHGFTAFFAHPTIKFSDRKKVFDTIRKYVVLYNKVTNKGVKL